MEIADYIFFSLISFTLIVIIAVACYGIYCWWKTREREPRSCYVEIADERSPLLAQCKTSVLGSRSSQNGSSPVGASPPVFTPTYRTPGSRRSNKVLVTSGGFPISTSLIRYGSSPRLRLGSQSASTKRSSRTSLEKFTLIRDYTPETYENHDHTVQPAVASTELENNMFDEIFNAIANSTSNSENHEHTAQPSVASTELENNMFDEIFNALIADSTSNAETPRSEVLLSNHSEPAGATGAHSSNHSEPASATEHSTINSDTVGSQENSGAHLDQASTVVHPSNPSDPASPVVEILTKHSDQVSATDACSTKYSDQARASTPNSKHSEPATLEVSECITTNAFTPAWYGHTMRNSSSSSFSSDYEARSSSADNSWLSSSNSSVCALECNSSSPADKNEVNIPQVHKGSIQYVVRGGKGFFTSDASIFSSIDL